MENIKNTTSSVLKIISLNDFSNIETNFTLNSTSETETELSQESNNVQQLWSLPKTTVTSLEDKSLLFNISRSTVHVSTTTLDSVDEFGPPEGIEYIFVPLGVMVFVIVLSAVVWTIMSFIINIFLLSHMPSLYLIALEYSLFFTAFCKHIKK